MKFYLKTNYINIIAIIILTSVVNVFILSKSVVNVFSFVQAIKFVCGVSVPILIVVITFSLTTYVVLGENNLIVFYFGFINSNVAYSKINEVELTEYGRGILARSSKKSVLVKMNNKKVAISLNDNAGFISEITRKIMK